MSMLNKTMRKSTFGFDTGADYEGYVEDNNLWNGWYNPYLTEAAAKQFVADYVASDEDPKLTWTSTGIKVDERHIYPNDDEAMYVVEGVDTDYGTLYPLGYYSWCWQESVD